MRKYLKWCEIFKWAKSFKCLNWKYTLVSANWKEESNEVKALSEIKYIEWPES